MRAWPFVLFALAVLAGGLFIERFLAAIWLPPGAGSGDSAKLKVF